MAPGEIDNAAAAQLAMDAPSGLPGFVELLARQAAGRTDRTRDAIEEGLAGKTADIMMRQAAAGRGRERRIEDADASW